MVAQVLLHITLLLGSMSSAILSVAAQAPIAKGTCTQTHCGDIEIPYPFGIEAGCYIDNWFQITCDHSTCPPKPLLNHTILNLVVLEISVEGTLKVKNPITVSAASCSNKPIHQAAYLGGSPFLFSKKNRCTVVGCRVMSEINSISDGLTISATCLSQCGLTTCIGLDCYQTTDNFSINRVLGHNC